MHTKHVSLGSSPQKRSPRALIKRRGIHSSGMALHSRIWNDSLSEKLSTPAGVGGKRKNKEGKWEEGVLMRGSGDIKCD